MRARTASCKTSFVGRTVAVPSLDQGRTVRTRGFHQVLAKTSLQFIRGIEETTVPEVRLTRAVDGSSGTATFRFQSPSILSVDDEKGDITGIYSQLNFNPRGINQGMYMIDEEGELSTVEVSAKFVNGKPEAVEARYSMKNPAEWDRFMRFMERYAEENGLGFQVSTRSLYPSIDFFVDRAKTNNESRLDLQFLERMFNLYALSNIKFLAEEIEKDLWTYG